MFATSREFLFFLSKRAKNDTIFRVAASLSYTSLIAIVPLFAIGLVAASLLAACVLPLTTAFVICEAFGWEAGVSFTWKEAPLFKGIFTFVIVVSAVVILVPNIDLMGIMLTAQFVNGVILPVLLVFMAIICTDKHVMDKYAVGKFTRVILCFTIVVVGILSAICLVMQILGIG